MSDRSSLRRSLLRWLLWPLVPILACSVFVTVHLAWQATENAFDLTLLDTALDLAHQVRVVGGMPALELPDVARQMLATSGEDRVVYVVRTASGEYVSGDPNLPVASFAAGDGRRRYYDTVINATPVRAIALRTALEDGRRQIDIAVAQTLTARHRVFINILGSLLIPEVLLAAAAIAVVWFGVRRGLAPAERLHREIVSRSPQDLHPIEEFSAPTELRPVLHAINGLLARLDATLGGQRRFIADAAHQLRTPLAALRARIELAQGKADGIAAETLAELLAVTERTTRLTNQLLALARAEHIHAAADTGAAVDLKHLVTELAGDWAMRAADRGIELLFDIQPLSVRGNAFLLGEMLGNLLDNAIRYTPAGGTIAVRTRNADDAVVIEVEDSGPGIPAQYRDQVRQRFFRLAGAPASGCGLGLAIVDEIVGAHGAQLHLSAAAKGGGLLVRVEFARPQISA